jgi:hypothetical protein
MSSLRLKPGLGFVVAIAVPAIVASSLVPRAHAKDGRHDDDAWLGHVEELVQVAEIDQLLADFHGALSYGGNISAMMSLWTEDSSLTFNGTPYDGKAAVQSFFTSGGYFHNNWVSLAPEYKTQITVHGDKAEVSTQCVAVDLSVTPNVVKGVVQLNGTVEKRGGKWFFTSVNSTSPAPL